MGWGTSYFSNRVSHHFTFMIASYRQTTIRNLYLAFLVSKYIKSNLKGEVQKREPPQNQTYLSLNHQHHSEKGRDLSTEQLGKPRLGK